MAEISYNKDLCVERHENITKKDDEQDRRLDGHDVLLENLQIKEGIHQTQINQLVLSIDNLVKIIKWLIGISATGLVGFFFYAIEQKIFG